MFLFGDYVLPKAVNIFFVKVLMMLEFSGNKKLTFKFHSAWKMASLLIQLQTVSNNALYFYNSIFNNIITRQ